MKRTAIAIGICLTLISAVPGQAKDATTEGLEAKVRALEAEKVMLWRRLAVLAIREFLADPKRANLSKELGKRLDEPADHMTVQAGPDNSIFVDQLRDHAPKGSFPAVDGKGAVVVDLNGPAGGGGRIGVAFNRAGGQVLAVVAIPGK